MKTISAKIAVFAVTLISAALLSGCGSQSTALTTEETSAQAAASETATVSESAAASESTATTSGTEAESSAVVSASSGAITADAAKTIALEHAGLQEADVTFIKAKLDTEDGRQVFDVEFYSGSAEYDYEIDASTGDILSYDYDVENFTAGTAAQSTSSASAAQITADAAKTIALEHAGLQEADVTFVKVKLDTEDGRQVYDVEFYSGTMEYEYELDASDGSILEFDAESIHD